MSLFLHRVHRALAALIVCGVLGCGGTDQLKVYRVTGKVLLEGKPMSGGGSISFMPVGANAARSAGGTIADDGSYSLTTYEFDDGAVAGEYRVVITQVTVKEPENTGDGTPVAVITATVAEADRIPETYSTQQSPITTKVEEKNNQLDFDLKRRPGG